LATAATAIATAPLQFNLGHANGNQPRRWKPLHRLNTFSWIYFSFKNNFRNGSNCKLAMAIATVNQWAINGAIESHCNGHFKLIIYIH